jgi:IMP dehydrogenase
MLSDSLLEGLTFDDVLLKPSRSGVMPSQVETGTLITRNIPLNIPIVSSAMDTVTESHLASSTKTCRLIVRRKKWTA